MEIEHSSPSRILFPYVVRVDAIVCVWDIYRIFPLIAKMRSVSIDTTKELTPFGMFNQTPKYGLYLIVKHFFPTDLKI